MPGFRVAMVACLLLLPAVSQAGAGFNLAWGTGCFPENPESNRAFGCDTGLLRDATVVGSFAVDQGVPDFVGIEAVVDLESEGSSLPDWWQFFNAGACRQTSLSASADFTTAPASQCMDPWSGQAAGGIAAYQTSATSPGVPSHRPTDARLKIVFAIASPMPIASSTEYYGFRIRVDAQRTVGAGACAGCNTPLTLSLSDLVVGGAQGSLSHITTALQTPCVTWQGPSAVCSGEQSRTRNATWGRVKSMYK